MIRVAGRHPVVFVAGVCRAEVVMEVPDGRSGRSRVGALGRGVAVLAGAVLALLLGTGSAAAHVEISVAPAQAGARDAVVTFTAAAESTSAGISALEVQVPQGISPSDVALVSAPQGWTLLATTDGYIVSGPPLPVGEQARYVVSVKQLPNTPSVAFKTLQSYTDGHIDRWIELPTPGGATPEHPAPMAALGTNGTPPSPAPQAEGHAHHPPSAQAAPADDGGVPAVLWAGIGVLAAGTVAGVALVFRRRATAGGAGG